MTERKESQLFFLRKIGKIEFILFAFSFTGMILNTLDIKGGKLVLGLGLNSFALLYVFVAIAFRRLQTKNQFDRIVSTFSYLFLSVLILGIMFTILNVSGVATLNHSGMFLVLLMMVIIQTRKIKVGKINSDTTSLLYRLMIFWVVGLAVFYILPRSVF